MRRERQFVAVDGFAGRSGICSQRLGFLCYFRMSAYWSRESRDSCALNPQAYHTREDAFGALGEGREGWSFLFEVKYQSAGLEVALFLERFGGGNGNVLPAIGGSVFYSSFLPGECYLDCFRSEKQWSNLGVGLGKWQVRRS